VRCTGNGGTDGLAGAAIGISEGVLIMKNTSILSCDGRDGSPSSGCAVSLNALSFETSMIENCSFLNCVSEFN
jgi:hypothetical protein